VQNRKDDLMNWVKTSDVHPLINGCVFHYEFLHIYPFSKGNERMALIWQMLLLAQWKLLFARIPLEVIVHSSQQDYFDILSTPNSTAFIEFMLDAIGVNSITVC